MRCALLFFVLVAILQSTNAQSLLDRKLDCSFHQQTQREALNQLMMIADTEIVFSSNFLNEEKRLSFSMQQASLRQILERILRGSNVGFKVAGDRILLLREQVELYTVSGYIEEAHTGERLIAATIYCSALNQGTTTNEYGFFSLSLPAGSHQIDCSYLGFQEYSWDLNLDMNVQRTIYLETNNYLAQVIVRPDSLENPCVVSTEENVFQLSPTLVDLVPGIGGENDPLRSTQLLPGVQGGSSGLGGILVRGSENDQNLMLMDGVAVYIPYHLFGVLSVYNASTVQSARLITGDFSARYGGGLASVFDFRTRDGNRYNWHAEAGTNLNNVNLVVEGPIAKEKTSVLLAARANHSSFLFQPFLSRTVFLEQATEFGTVFWDLNFKLNHEFSKKDRIYLSYYNGADQILANNSIIGDDAFEEELIFEVDWGNTISALRWNHLFNEKLFANISYSYSANNFQYAIFSHADFFEDDYEEEYAFYTVLSDIKDHSFKVDFDYLPKPVHTFRFGGGFSDRTFSPAIVYYDDSTLDEMGVFEQVDDFNELIEARDLPGKEWFAYVEDKITLTAKSKIDLGIRTSWFGAESRNFLTLEPRLTLSHEFSSRLRWRASVNRTVQYLHLISSATLQLPTDLWLPSSDQIAPKTAWQYETGLQFSANEQAKVSVTAYYKTLNNLYTLPEAISTTEIGASDFEDILLRGSGKSQGVECLIDAHFDNFGLIASYTLAKSDRYLNGDAQEEAFPFAFDARHQWKLFGYWKLGKNLHVSANWQYFSPVPRSYLQRSESGDAVVNIQPGQEDGEAQLRSRPYHRLDMELNYEIQKDRLSHHLKLGAYNLYSRKNIAFYSIDDNSIPLKAAQPIESIAFLPTLGYQLRF